MPKTTKPKDDGKTYYDTVRVKMPVPKTTKLCKDTICKQNELARECCELMRERVHKTTKPKKKVHRHRYEFWEDVNKAPMCALVCFCGRRKGR